MPFGYELTRIDTSWPECDSATWTRNRIGLNYDGRYQKIYIWNDV